LTHTNRRRAKIRFGFVGLFLRLTNNWRALEKVTADEWMMKWAGKQVYEQMWKPLLIGTFGPIYEDVNMAWMWARIKARTTRLGTFRGGFQRFADLFAEKLRAMGVEIRPGAQVKRVVDINALRALAPTFPGHHAPSPARRPPLEPQAQRTFR
jgi:protoporphyrinogen oxidase